MSASVERIFSTRCGEGMEERAQRRSPTPPGRWTESMRVGTLLTLTNGKGLEREREREREERSVRRDGRVGDKRGGSD